MLRQTWRKKSSRTRKRKRNKEIGPTERLPRFRIFVFLLDKSIKSWYTVDTVKMRYFHGDGSERRCFKKHFLTLLHNILHSASGDSNTVCRAENRRRQNRLFSALCSNICFCVRIAADRPFFLLFLPLSDGSVRDPKYSPSARDICSFVFSAVRSSEKSTLPVFGKKRAKKIPERRDRPFFAPREISEPNRDAVDTDADLQFSFRIKSKETLYSRFFLIIDAIINAHPITANITLKVISILSIY